MAAPKRRLTHWPHMSTEPPYLALEGVGFAYDGQDYVARDIDWSARTGGFDCLLGRSGCGKTTVLKLIAGLLQPTVGEVRLDGVRVEGPSRDIGFVFQTPALLEWRTVLENVLLPISLERRPSPIDRDEAMALLARVGIPDLADRYPREISGGQQSRTALVRALIGAPSLLLMDEPFAALDAITREELQDDLLRLTADRKTTVVFVTHDISEAVYLGDRVAVMEAGRIAHVAPVGLPKPRGGDMRHTTEFNGVCRDLRQAMAEAGQQAAA